MLDLTQFTTPGMLSTSPSTLARDYALPHCYSLLLHPPPGPNKQDTCIRVTSAARALPPRCSGVPLWPALIRPLRLLSAQTAWARARRAATTG
jgi:hypothetical protein